MVHTMVLRLGSATCLRRHRGPSLCHWDFIVTKVEQELWLISQVQSQLRFKGLRRSKYHVKQFIFVHIPLNIPFSLEARINK